MEITWNELLKYDEVKRIEAFKKIYDDSREFKKYQSMLRKAQIDRTIDSLNEKATKIIDEVILK